jgi:hypothetical protein
MLDDIEGTHQVKAFIFKWQFGDGSLDHINAQVASSYSEEVTDPNFESISELAPVAAPMFNILNEDVGLITSANRV